MNYRKKLLRITTVSDSLNDHLKGQLKFLNTNYEVVGIASDAGNLQEVASREGIRVINIPMKRNISLRNDFKSLLALIRILRKENPFIVHANTPKASLLSMVAAKICSVPHRLYTVTGLRFETAKGLFRRILIWMERISCLCATKVIPEGNGVKETLARERITSKPLKVILNGNINGIDAEYFNPDRISEQCKEQLRQELDIDPNDFTFVFVGRLVGDKGIDELVSVFSRFGKSELLHESEKPKRLKLLLVGAPEQELDPLSAETLEAIHNNPGIIPVGFQKDVRPYLAIADTLVFPSYREGFPNVVMQAGAMGLPSIVTNINGCNEIIIQDKNGIVISPKDENALFEAMNHILHHPEETCRMARNARPLIISRYEQNMVWNAVLQEYRSLEKKVEE